MSRKLCVKTPSSKERESMMDSHKIENESNLIIEPDDVPIADAHRLLLHCVSPRPIGFTSTISASGVCNLAPFSYYMVGGANPPSVVISSLSGRAGEPKDTLRNIKEIGEFAISVVTYEMRERMSISAANFPYGVSEWNDSGFTPAPSKRIKPPHIKESPLSIECKLYKIVPHGVGPVSANYIIGEVVCFHVSREIMPGGVIDPTKIDYLARLGGDWYARLNSDAMFEMPVSENKPR
jgi:flavin reductase (DIM6/NTAB) family NADH-FMN oxidoreductase RutF